MNRPLKIRIFSDRPIDVGDYIEIDLEIYNSKASTITGVTVIPTKDSNVFPSKYFVGEMNPNDVFSAHFTLDSDDLDHGEHNVSFKVIFKEIAVSVG